MNFALFTFGPVTCGVILGMRVFGLRVKGQGDFVLVSISTTPTHIKNQLSPLLTKSS